MKWEYRNVKEECYIQQGRQHNPHTLLPAARKRNQTSPFVNGSHDIVYDAAKPTAAVWIIPCTAQNEIMVHDVHELIFKYKLQENVCGIWINTVKYNK